MKPLAKIEEPLLTREARSLLLFDDAQTSTCGHVESIEEKVRRLEAENLALIEANRTLTRDSMNTITMLCFYLLLTTENSQKDSLSGLLNRRGLDNALPDVMNRARLENKKLGFIILDIDYFKDVNDTYGHPAGDQILASISKIISNDIRDYDIVSRYGGEEFLIVMEAKNLKVLTRRAEKIRQDIQKNKFEIDGENGKCVIRLTASLGITIMDPSVETSAEHAIFRADQGLYNAKRTGRNRIGQIDIFVGYTNLSQDASSGNDNRRDMPKLSKLDVPPI